MEIDMTTETTDVRREMVGFFGAMENAARAALDAQLRQKLSAAGVNEIAVTFKVGSDVLSG